jgi:hypothetical protein
VKTRAANRMHLERVDFLESINDSDTYHKWRSEIYDLAYQVKRVQQFKVPRPILREPESYFVSSLRSGIGS